MASAFDWIFNTGETAIHEATGKDNPMSGTVNALVNPGYYLINEYGLKEPATKDTPGAIQEGGGGGEGEGGDSMESIFEQYLRYNPQFAAQALEMVQQYQPEYQRMAEEGIRGERARSLEEVRGALPQLQRIREEYETPQETAMRKYILGTTMQDLFSGESLTPRQRLQTEEYVRTGQRARGINEGAPAAMRESVAKALAGMGIGAQRRQAAQGVMATEQASRADPYATVLGMPTPAFTTAVQQTQAGMNKPSLELLAGNYWNQKNLDQAMRQYNLQNQIAQAQASAAGVEWTG